MGITGLLVLELLLLLLVGSGAGPVMGLRRRWWNLGRRNGPGQARARRQGQVRLGLGI